MPSAADCHAFLTVLLLCAIAAAESGDSQRGSKLDGEFACLGRALAGCVNATSSAANCRSCAHSSLRRCGASHRLAFYAGACQQPPDESPGTAFESALASAAAAASASSRKLRCLLGQLGQCQAFYLAVSDPAYCRRCVDKAFRWCRTTSAASFEAGLCGGQPGR